MGRRSGIGAIISAVGRAQRAAAAAQRRAAREADRRARAAAREARERDRARIAHNRELEREAKRQHLEDQIESAADRTEAIAATIEELDTVLRHTLAANDVINFESLRVPESYPDSNPPVVLTTPAAEPQLDAYLSAVRPLTFLQRLLPGAEERRERRLKEAADAYEVAATQFRAYEADRLGRLTAFKKAYDEERFGAIWEATQRNSEVAEFESRYRKGEAEAVVAYNVMVLDRSEYPSEFPQRFRVAYNRNSRELVVDYSLPPVAVIPAISEVRYVKARDSFEEKPRKPAEIRERYQTLVSAVALRTLHEAFEADQAKHLDVVTFSGYVEAVDPATGNDIRPYLVSVRTTRGEFEKIDLRRVDPRVCIRNLGASVSARADELSPVKPIIEFDMVDPRFVDQTDVLSELDARPNIMDLTPFQFENLVGNVFTKMGLDTRQTRSSRDGGVDVVAYDSRPVLGGRVVIQAKRYRHTVGVAAVRDLFGTMMNEGANKGILVTTSGYGPDAFAFAKDKPIELVDGGALLYLCDQVGVRARIVMPAE